MSDEEIDILCYTPGDRCSYFSIFLVLVATVKKTFITHLIIPVLCPAPVLEGCRWV